MLKLYFYGALFTSVCIRVFADQFYYHNGNNYTVNNQPTSWSGAESFCYKQLGHLASSTNASSNNFLYNTSIKAEEFWLGGYNYNGAWNWRNAHFENYTNWAPGEPSHSQSGYCIAMIKATGKWRAANCMEQKPSACEPPISREWDYGNCDPSVMWEWHPEVNKCYYNTGGLAYTSFDGLVGDCKSLEFSLTKVWPLIIHSDHEMSIVQGMMDIHAGNGCTERFMLGLHDPYNNGSYVWADGSAVDYENWDPDSTPPPGVCFFAFAKGEKEWNPSLCEDFGVSTGVICQYTP